MLPLEGKLVTADALHCQREFCSEVRADGGDYMAIVKLNQPTLYRDIELLFRQPPEDEVFSTVEQCDRHGDRRELRRLLASTALCGYLDWPDVGQVCKVERVSVRKGKESRQVRYAITSLREDVGPDALLKHVRGHWGIENRLPRRVGARRDFRGGRQPGSYGVGATGDGGIAQCRAGDTASGRVDQHRRRAAP